MEKAILKAVGVKTVGILAFGGCLALAVLLILNQQNLYQNQPASNSALTASAADFGRLRKQAQAHKALAQKSAALERLSIRHRISIPLPMGGPTASDPRNPSNYQMYAYLQNQVPISSRLPP